MATHDIAVIGASADGLQALAELLRRLPGELPVAIFLVLHTGPTGGRLLPSILSRAGTLPVVTAQDGAPIVPGRAYLPPPDRHLLVHRGRMVVVNGARENGFRPAIDPLFRSAARAYGPRVIGVILSGMLDDGAWGLREVLEAGGVGLAQDPFEATFPDMPRAALRLNPELRPLPLAAIADRIVELASTTVPDDAWSEMDDRDALERPDALETGERRGRLTRLTCPDCNGALEEWGDTGSALRYRCHLGHGHTARSLMLGQGNLVETALWQAARALEESAALRRRMAERAELAGNQDVVAAYEQQAGKLVDRAQAIRGMLESQVPAEEVDGGEDVIG